MSTKSKPTPAKTIEAATENTYPTPVPNQTNPFAVPQVPVWIQGTGNVTNGMLATEKKKVMPIIAKILVKTGEARLIEDSEA